MSRQCEHGVDRDGWCAHCADQAQANDLAYPARSHTQEIAEARQERDEARGKVALMLDAFWFAISDLGHAAECDGERNCTCWREAAHKVEVRDEALALCTRVRDLEDERDELLAREKRDEEYLRGVLADVVEKNGGLALCSWCALPTKNDELMMRHHQEQECTKNPMRITIRHFQDVILDALYRARVHAKAEWLADAIERECQVRGLSLK